MLIGKYDNASKILRVLSFSVELTRKATALEVFLMIAMITP